MSRLPMDYDGAGQPFLSAEVEDELARRLEERQIALGDEGYDDAVEEILAEMEKELEQAEYDAAESRAWDREDDGY